MPEVLATQSKPTVNALLGTIALSPFEHGVVTLTALGGVPAKIARLLHAAPDQIVETQALLIQKFEMPNMAAVIHQAILSQQLPVQIRPNKKLAHRMRPREIAALDDMAAGRSNRQIAEILEMNVDTFVSNVSKPLYIKLAARTREHAVYRGHQAQLL